MSEPLFALKEIGYGGVGVFNWTDNEILVLMEVGVLGCLWCSDAPFGRCGPMRVLSVFSFRLSFPPFIRGEFVTFSNGFVSYRAPTVKFYYSMIISNLFKMYRCFPYLLLA